MSRTERARNRRRSFEALLLAGMGAFAVACGDDAGSSGGGSATSTTSTLSTTSTSSSPAGPGGAGGAASTGGAGGTGGFVAGDTQCSDGIDNDGDGQTDSADGECVGPLDNDESSFATGIPGDNKDPCRQDCFFDGNSGAGDDKCEWNLKCDEASPGAPKCPYDANYKNCPETQAEVCIATCKTITPNGCDCFGCCEVFFESGPKTVYLGSEGCSLETPENCKACTPTDSCNNTCDTCELCLGKETLPPECQGGTGGGAASSGSGGSGGSVQQCGTGVQACGQPGQDPCASGFYCITGCCQAIPK